MDSTKSNVAEMALLKTRPTLLVRVLCKSRDKWKQKYMTVKKEIKRYKNRAADASKSRERWKGKAEQLETEKSALAARNAELERELAEVQKSK